MRGFFLRAYACLILMKQQGNEEELPASNSELTVLRDCKSSASELNKRCNVKFSRVRNSAAQ